MPTDEKVEQMRQYFMMLTESSLIEQHGEEHGRELSERFRHRFLELINANEYLMPDSLARHHGTNPLFIMALEDILKPTGITREVLTERVLNIYRTMLGPILEGQATKLESSNDAWRTFVQSAKIGNKNFYDNEYFQLKIVEDDSTQFGFDINKCIYFDIFRENGRAELAPILCEYDFILSANVDDWVRFERDETIADGYPQCKFRYSRA
ncbi:MAG: L-2-amino-thiazoline-4-carboxylic acid hydrolase [Candidatus Thorarchaeota archaeon]|jgi:hypothetical protein